MLPPPILNGSFRLVHTFPASAGADALLAVDPALGRSLEMCLVVGRGVDRLSPGRAQYQVFCGGSNGKYAQVL